MDLWWFENELAGEGCKLICGVDEAGRGPLAGPVYAAAVILPLGLELKKLGDSKKIPEETRERLYKDIMEGAEDYAIGSADCREVDELNILQATFLAMNRAIDALKVVPDIALIDGNRSPGANCRTECIVGGDGKSASIAAASILAKVSRDRYMADMALKYPEYAFEKHKGYGTKLHYERLNEFGPSEIHRVSFLKKWQNEGKWRIENGKWKIGDGAGGSGLTNSGCNKARVRGALGERIAEAYLIDKGYTVVEKGFRSPFGEIDLIVMDGEYMAFVEVKLRKDASFAEAREFVGKAKQKKLTATANIWLASHKTKLQPRFDVVEIYTPDDIAEPEIIHIENAF